MATEKPAAHRCFDRTGKSVPPEKPPRTTTGADSRPTTGGGAMRVEQHIRTPAGFRGLLFSLVAMMFCTFGYKAGAGESVCADVKIEIRQELTLERQAFDARMRIHNGLSHIALEDIAAAVVFTDADGYNVPASDDPNDPDALFFIRIDRLENIGDVSGAGSVAPSDSADIHWLIVPAPGASDGLPMGKRFFVGAELSYTIGGEPHLTPVAPDAIFVRPLPELSLDYFIPAEVYGDDAWTAELEPPVPFSLGLRVGNHGGGTAEALKIDAAQAKITENEQGLLIGFAIESCAVDGQAAAENLLADLGDLEPGAFSTVCWTLTCSLSGSFVSFDAGLAHSDALGGELTSLIRNTETHLLMRDVRVDLPGRDGLKDFLAMDGDVCRVYESQGCDSRVTDASASAGLQFEETTAAGDVFQLSVSAAAGFVFVGLADPFDGQKAVSGVRSDGKRIKKENLWLSKIRCENPEDGWYYRVNLFDADTTGAYRIVFSKPPGCQAPVLTPIPDQTGVEGMPLSFGAAAADPDGTFPALSAKPLPAGADFTDSGDGSALFEWVPAFGQAGIYEITVQAADGTTSNTQRVRLRIHAIDDTDGDGLLDDWEMQHFGSLERGGSGDFDGDGIVDAVEFGLGTDPCIANTGPATPRIESPADLARVSAVSPVLTVENSAGPDGGLLSYDFEVYADAGMTVPAAAASGVLETADTTAWPVSPELTDNHWYHWRVRACDGTGYSLWVYGRFFVDTQNDAPQAFRVSRPADNTRVDTRMPVLAVAPSRDADADALVYTFEVYEDSGLTLPVAGSGDVPAGLEDRVVWTVDTPLADQTGYFWRVAVRDTRGASAETAVSSFFVDLANSAPQAPLIAAPVMDSESDSLEVLLTVDNAVDIDGDPLTYHFELDKAGTFDSGSLQSSGEAAEGMDVTSWRTGMLMDDTNYFWRVKASDGNAESAWARGRFFVNLQNDPPATPVAGNPGEGAWLNSTAPAFEVLPSSDPDRDSLGYVFEVYADATLSDCVARGETDLCAWTAGTALTDHRLYYWRVHARDEHGADSAWSPPVPFFVHSDSANEPQSVSVRVADDGGRPFTGVRVYAFTGTGAYTGRYGTTDAEGRATFTAADFTGGTYRFRVDYLGQQFWSGDAALPGTPAVCVTIPMETVTVMLDSPAAAAEGVRVYGFDEGGSYLGICDETDETAAASFDLPADKNFKFRADLLGHQYWSGAFTVTQGGPNDVRLGLGGGFLQVLIRQAPQSPMEGLNVYLFSESGGYLGRYAATDASGEVVFGVSRGNFKVRADYLGYAFWSEPVWVAGDLILNVDIAHQDVGVAVNGWFKGAAAPLEGIKTYLFTESGAYQGRYHVTGADGRVIFRLPLQAYKVRADYLGGRFWSNAFTWQDGAVDVPMAEAAVEVTGGGLPLEGISVYLFSGSGAYLDRNGGTDGEGRVVFRLPAGVYDFRADYQGSRFWSGARDLAADQINPVAISTGGGEFVLTVEQNPGIPLVGAKCHVFSAAGSYLGLSDTTSSEGRAAFQLAGGDYRVRVDHLGYPFWTDTYTVPSVLSDTFFLWHQDTIVHVNGVYQGTVTPLAGVAAYLFAAGGAYQGQSRITDAAGQAVFNLPQQAYTVRADYLGGKFWSDVFTWQDAAVDIDMADAAVTVTGSGRPLEGLPVYVFSSGGAYLGRSAVTDAGGQSLFRLPAGDYKFRADYQGSQYWSDIRALTAGRVNPVEISAGGGVFALTLLKGENTPLDQVKCYVFSEGGSYLGLSGITSGDGQVSFELADGTCRFRVDYLGCRFWTPFYTVPEVLQDVVTIDHKDVTVVVGCHYQGAEQPLPGLRVYLFSSAGSYLGQHRTSDADGRAVFNLPEQAFKVRVDYLGGRHWSSPFQWTDTSVSIPHGWVSVHLHRCGTDAAGAKVYLFSDSGTYLGRCETTDSSGNAFFLLPDRAFKFRGDEGGDQVWSPITTVSPGETISVEIDLDGF